MHYDVIEAEIIDHLVFQVKFSDGLSGEVQLLPSFLHGVFEPLKNPEVFNQLKVTEGFIAWNDDLDLAPDAMYSEIAKQGKWLLS